MEAWYEAVVLNAIADVYRVKWRDYPGTPLTRQRHELALMFPTAKATSAA
ncbi:hypothetical protein [Microvirga aerophila]|nr:hypothetical protein [Microvirga aerophila]